jgi:predicted small secreted protein
MCSFASTNDRRGKTVATTIMRRRYVVMQKNVSRSWALMAKQTYASTLQGVWIAAMKDPSW